MTGVNSSNVFTGGPDQATTGAILRAPLGTALPTAIASTLDAAFVDSGYISEDGLKNTPDRTLLSIKDWSMATIRRVLSEFNDTLAWAHLETNAASLKNYVGDANTTVTAPTVSSGTLITAVLNASDAVRYSWVFKVKDGSRKVLIVVPDGDITKLTEIEFKKAVPIKWGVELSTYPDTSGNYVYIYTDDGVFSA